MENTLYNLTRADARILATHFEWDAGLIGLALWNAGKAQDPESGAKRAVKLIKFAKEQ